MTRVEELEQLSTKDLHDRAVHLAERRLDLKFLWELAKAIPVAEAAIGDLGEAEEHIVVGNVAEFLRDWAAAGEGELGDALRPLYIEYLAKHE